MMLYNGGKYIKILLMLHKTNYTNKTTMCRIFFKQKILNLWFVRLRHDGRKISPHLNDFDIKIVSCETEANTLIKLKHEHTYNFKEWCEIDQNRDIDV